MEMGVLMFTSPKHTVTVAQYIERLGSDSPDEGVARGGLSVFAHFSGFKGMDFSSLPVYVKNAAGICVKAMNCVTMLEPRAPMHREVLGGSMLAMAELKARLNECAPAETGAAS